MATLNSYKVYGLASSENEDAIRYVGITKGELNVRVNHHRNYHLKNSNKRGNWVGSVIRNGYELMAVVLDKDLDKDAAVEKEIAYIKLFKSFGADLVNGTSGGDGVHDRAPLSEESREKMRQAKLLNPPLHFLEYWKDKKRPGNVGYKGHPQTEATKRKLSATHTGKILSKEHRHNMSLAQRGSERLGARIAFRVTDKEKNISFDAVGYVDLCNKIGGERTSIIKFLRKKNGKLFKKRYSIEV